MKRRIKAVARRLRSGFGRTAALALLLVVACAGLAALVVGVAADDALWGVGAFLALSLVLGLLALIVLLQRRLLHRTAAVARTLERLERQGRVQHQDSTTTLNGMAAQVRATAVVANRLTGPLDHGIALRDDLLRVERHLFAEGRADTAQIEAYLQLLRWAPPPAHIPATRGWAASADHLALLVDQVIAARPARILDIGSGLTTVWMALAAAQHGIQTQIVALDHDADFAERTREVLRRNGLEGIAEVRHAPLVPFGQDGARWYSPDAYADLRDIELLSIDGPPTTTGPQARYPALPALAGRLSAGVVIVLDDANRDDEQAAVAHWLHDRPDLTKVSHPTEKGTVILTASPLGGANTDG